MEFVAYVEVKHITRKAQNLEEDTSKCVFTLYMKCCDLWIPL